MIKQQVVNEIHRDARRNFLRRPVILKGIDDLWQADLIDFRSLKTYNGGHVFILVVIDCFSKYAWVKPLKTKNQFEVTNAFRSILQSTNRHPNNLQTDKGTEFFNNSFKKLINTYKINHYSTFSTKKASIVERLIKTLKGWLFKNFSMNGSYKWIGATLQKVVDDYNNSKHRTTKFKPIDITTSNENFVRSNIYKSSKTNKTFKQKFKIGDFVRVSKYKNCFEKGYTPNWSTEIFKVLKINDTCPVTYLVEDLSEQKIFGSFYEQELQKTKYPYIYLIEKVLKKRGNKMFVKWLGFDNSHNSWITHNALVI